MTKWEEHRAETEAAMAKWRKAVRDWERPDARVIPTRQERLQWLSIGRVLVAPRWLRLIVIIGVAFFILTHVNH